MDRVLAPWLDALLADRQGLELFDAHAHLGTNDPDGFSLGADDLLEALRALGARTVVAPMHEPDGYPPANDAILAAAEDSDGLLAPFCRLDPRSDPLREARRCLDAGARGIKLHPRAERFALGAPEVDGIVALAHDRRLPVLIHAGRGIPTLGEHALALARRYPDARLILAHAAISDLAWLIPHVGDQPNLLFDTAWWSSADLLFLFAHVPAGQIVLGTDPPYAPLALGAVLALRCALEVGHGADVLREVAGAQIARLVAGEAPRQLGPAPGAGGVEHDLGLQRVEAFLISAIARLIVGQSGEEGIALARLACRVPGRAPHRAVYASIEGLLERSAAFEPAAPGLHAPGLSLLVAAACLARTPSAPLPAIEA